MQMLIFIELLYPDNIQLPTYRHPALFNYFLIISSSSSSDCFVRCYVCCTVVHLCQTAAWRIVKQSAEYPGSADLSLAIERLAFEMVGHLLLGTWIIWDMYYLIL